MYAFYSYYDQSDFFYVKRFAQIQKETAVIRYIVRTTRNKQQQKN